MRKLCLLAVIALTSRALAACPTQPPQLVAPANAATNVASPVNFDWNDVTNATGYRLWASFNGGTPNIIALTPDSQYTTDIPAGSVDWWVDALAGANCTIVTSQHFHFTAVGGTASCSQNPTSPTLMAPASGATGLASPVTLSWTGVVGATEYRIFASLNGAPAVVLGTTTFTQVSVPFPQGPVTWFVEAVFDGCPSTFSRFGTFTVATGAPCSTTPTALVAPANNAIVASSPVAFQWNSVPGAVGYKLYINGDVAATTTGTSASRVVGTGPTTWRVDTMYAGCADVPSTTFTFTIPAPACSGSITLQTPAEGATVSSPANLTWTPVSSATAYRIWVSIDGSPPTILARTSTNSQSLFTPSGNVAWFVEALFAQCQSVLSPVGHFTVTPAANCSNNKAPVLVAPINGVQAQTPVDFTWNAANGAMLYRVWVSVDGSPFEDVGITKSTDLKTDVSGSNVQWYVETFFNGCPAVNSATASFTVPQPAGCANDTTVLISPPNSTNSSAPVTMAWSAVANADDYRVFATFNNSNPVMIGHTKDTSFTSDLPPGTISWWVETTFDSCPSTKSLHSNFVIPRAANCGTDVPQLVSPADGTTNLTSPVRLDWDPVSGGVGYAVFIRHNGGAATLLGRTTTVTETTKRLPEGNIEWWVVAFFAACPPVQSQHRTFAIPASTCSNRQPVLMTPADGTTGLTSSVHLSWSAVPKATSYKIWVATDPDDEQSSVLTTTTTNRTTVQMPAGDIDWYVEAIIPNCPSVSSSVSGFSVRKNAPACDTPSRPSARAPGQVASGTPFTINWTSEANATNYELQESTAASFANATTQTIADTSTTITHTATTQPQRFFYRVRADSNCADDHSPYSKIVSVVVVPPQAKNSSVDVSVQNGITQQVALPAQNPPATFSARSDKPWITVTPSSGTVGPQGATLTVTFDSSALKLGTNTGTVIVTYGTSGPIRADGVAPVIPVSVSLVTPVAQNGKNTPPPDSLIIPAVGHAPGANNSMFVSDVRVANTAAQIQTYQLNFTLTGTDGTQSGQSTTIAINPGDTMALDDILSNFFGIGSDGSAATGVLEIRPLSSTDTSQSQSTTPSIQTVASSRTFDTTPNGTFGQFVPAIPFSQFVSQGTRLSLQQVAQSAAYRTNIGLVEASGQPASVLLHVFNDSGTEVTTIPQNLLPSQHLQLNAILPPITDGRVEVEVTSATGKVSAYASVVDNVTNDPLLVSPVQTSTVTAQSYTLPGVGDFDVGIAHWKSDVRVFNSGSSSTPVTLTYFPQTGTPPQPVTTTIAANTVLALNNLIATTWPGLTQTAGSLKVTTTSSSALVTTARTYTQLTSGTYGQFIPGVTPASSIGNGDSPLQVLQLESSTNYRTNIGVAETSGNPATVHVSLILPDSKFAIGTDISLAANQFYQFPLSSFGVPTVYNGRVTVSVTGGSGRVTAYGSVIDQITQDPTYVPAQ